MSLKDDKWFKIANAKLKREYMKEFGISPDDHSKSVRSRSEDIVFYARHIKFWMSKKPDQLKTPLEIATSAISTDGINLIEEWSKKHNIYNDVIAYLSNDYITCNTCSKEAKFECVQCREAIYCSPECQKKHWKFHKKFCLEHIKRDTN